MILHKFCLEFLAEASDEIRGYLHCFSWLIDLLHKTKNISFISVLTQSVPTTFTRFPIKGTGSKISFL